MGFGLKQTALLIKANVGLEVACVDLGDWDRRNAGTNDGYLRDHLKEFGDSIAAFLKDMGDAMAHVTVITMSEFGRRVAENAHEGLERRTRQRHVHRRRRRQRAHGVAHVFEKGGDAVAEFLMVAQVAVVGAGVSCVSQSPRSTQATPRPTLALMSSAYCRGPNPIRFPRGIHIILGL